MDLIFPILLAAAEGAGEYGEAAAEPNLMSGTIWQSLAAIVAFVLVAMVLGKYAWGPIITGLQAREDQIKGDLDQANAAKAEADRTLAEYKQQLAEARTESQQIIADSRQQAQKAADQIKADSQRELDTLKQRAKAEIEQAKRDAVAEVYDKAAEVGTAIAGQILKREVTVDDQRGLVDRTLRELDRLPSN